MLNTQGEPRDGTVSMTYNRNLLSQYVDSCVIWVHARTLHGLSPGYHLIGDSRQGKYALYVRGKVQDEYARLKAAAEDE